MARIEVADGSQPPKLESVRTLLLEYREWLGSRCVADFVKEYEGLPGDYSPPRGALLLATVDGESTGCIALRPLDRSTAEIKRLYVKPGYRGHRIGSLLTSEIIRLAREQQYSSLVLDTIPGAMDHAIAIYEACGFTERPLYAGCHEKGSRAYELIL